MNQNEIKDKFESVHLTINRYLWIFCGLLIFFLWLCVRSSKFFTRPLKRIALVSSLPSERKVAVWKFFPPIPLQKKKSLYAWILSFIYKVAHSLWNILFPFFPTCVWIREVHYVWLTWRFPQGCSRILFGKWSDPL